MVKQLDLPKNPDSDASTRPKLMPCSVSEAPPEVGEFEAQAVELGLAAHVATGASYVNEDTIVATMLATLSVSPTFGPAP